MALEEERTGAGLSSQKTTSVRHPDGNKDAPWHPIMATVLCCPSQHPALRGWDHKREMMAEPPSSNGTALDHENTGWIMTVKLGHSGRYLLGQPQTLNMPS